jgi:hypothetical protein
MSKITHMNRISLAALACAMAVPPTPVFAQEADPSITPTVQPVDAAPSATDSSADLAPTTVAEPADSALSSAASPARAKSVAKVARPVSTVKATSASAPKTKPSTDVASTVPSTVETSAPPIENQAPIEDVADAQAIPAVPSAAPSSSSDEIAFGGILALLAVGAGALGLSRRRKVESVRTDDDLDIVPEPTPVRREIDLAPQYAEPPRSDRSAFNWGQSVPAPAALSPTEKARRGPTPDNPSMSLKKRLKRAAFFEQRERDAAAGRAVSVSRFAGIPTAMIESARETIAAPRRESQPA